MMQAKPDFTKPNPISKIEYRPLALFESGQDLPLFTQSCDSLPCPFTNPDHANIAMPELEQMSLFSEVRQ